ncbi:MAG: NUDIX hydrolase [Tagaea sp.]
MPPPILATNSTVLSPYVTLVDRRVEIDGREQSFHGMAVADYVNVLAIARDGRVALVEQFRPMIGRSTLELPGGHRDPGEDPAATARRELHEETGLIAGAVSQMCVLSPDPARLTNRFWGYVARDCAPDPGWRPEPDTRASLVEPAQLAALVAEGRFDNAPHVALYALAIAGGLLPPTVPARQTEPK